VLKINTELRHWCQNCWGWTTNCWYKYWIANVDAQLLKSNKTNQVEVTNKLNLSQTKNSIKPTKANLSWTKKLNENMNQTQIIISVICRVSN